MKQIYVSIGNSDDKLSQHDWWAFIRAVQYAINKEAIQIHGEWFSLPDSRFQNACFTFTLTDARTGFLQQALRDVGQHFYQDAIMWHEVGREAKL